VGNPWNVRLEVNPYPPDIVTPDGIDLTITGNHTNNNFSFLVAAAQVTGYVKDENNNPLSNQGVTLNRNDFGIQRQVNNLGSSGFFQIGLLLADLNGQTWNLRTDCNCGGGNYITTTKLLGQAGPLTISSGDSLFRQLTIYSANAHIRGQVTINGNPPNFPIQIIADNADTAQAAASSDSLTGNFSINVSNKIYNYSIFPVNYGPGFVVSVNAHAGDTGVVVNIIIESVKEREPGIPNKFALNQNYPNPFNPTTDIDYDIAAISHVKLSIVNILGQEIMTLVNGEQHAGKYKATVDASNLPSGIYFYRLIAGNYVQIKKMILMK
jgi:hypothetical protein